MWLTLRIKDLLTYWDTRYLRISIDSNNIARSYEVGRKKFEQVISVFYSNYLHFAALISGVRVWLDIR